MSTPRYYPVYLDLTGRPVTVVGGGEVAAEKVGELLAAGARVTVVAPRLVPELAALAVAGDVEHRDRSFVESDADGAVLLLAEREDAEHNAAVFAAAEARGVFANVQDDVPHCSFIAPSVVRRGHLTVAISTAGKAPVLAVRLRQRLEGELGPEHAEFLDLAGRLRAPLARQVPDFATRRERWYRLVDSDVLALLAAGDAAAAEQRAAEILGVAPEVPA